MLACAACTIWIVYADACCFLSKKLALPEACAVDHFSCSLTHYPLWIHLARDHCKATGSPFACLGLGSCINFQKNITWQSWQVRLVIMIPRPFSVLQQGLKSSPSFQIQGERPPTKMCVKLFSKYIDGHISTDSLRSKYILPEDGILALTYLSWGWFQMRLPQTLSCHDGSERTFHRMRCWRTMCATCSLYAILGLSFHYMAILCLIVLCLSLNPTPSHSQARGEPLCGNGLGRIRTQLHVPGWKSSAFFSIPLPF